VPFANGQPSGMPVDILTGFLGENNDAMGCPVGVEIASDGALLMADDVGKVIWRVTPQAGLAAIPQPEAEETTGENGPEDGEASAPEQ